MIGYLTRERRAQIPSVRAAITACNSGTYVPPTSYYIMTDIAPLDNQPPEPEAVSWIVPDAEERVEHPAPRHQRSGPHAPEDFPPPPPYFASPTPNTTTGVRHDRALNFTLNQLNIDGRQSRTTTTQEPHTPQVATPTRPRARNTEESPSRTQPRPSNLPPSTPTTGAHAPRGNFMRSTQSSNQPAVPSPLTETPHSGPPVFYLNHYQRRHLKVYHNATADALDSLSSRIMSTRYRERDDLLESFVPKLKSLGMNNDQAILFVDWVFCKTDWEDDDDDSTNPTHE
jgi:hypothetical protein